VFGLEIGGAEFVAKIAMMYTIGGGFVGVGSTEAFAGISLEGELIRDNFIVDSPGGRVIKESILRSGCGLETEDISSAIEKGLTKESGFVGREIESEAPYAGYPVADMKFVNGEDAAAEGIKIGNKEFETPALVCLVLCVEAEDLFPSIGRIEFYVSVGGVGL